MADLAGYIGPNVSSGAYVWDSISWSSANTNGTIGTLRTLLVGVQWTQPTLEDGDLDGTLATTMVAPDGFPYHAAGTTAPCVPDVFGGALVGIFGGSYFVFWDPAASTPPQSDPTGGVLDGFPILGVPCGGSSVATMNNFLAIATGASPWNWYLVEYTVYSGEEESIAYLFMLIAQHTGPVANVDSHSADGLFEPSIDNWFGGYQAPSGGGWNVYSKSAPVTGDVMRLRIHEDYENAFIDLNMPWGFLTPVLGTGANFSATTTYPQPPVCYVWDQTTPGTFHGIAGVANAIGAPVVVDTGAAHGFIVGDYVFFYNVIGGLPFLQGSFAVQAVPTASTFQIAQTQTYSFTNASTDTRTSAAAGAAFNLGAGPYQIALGLAPYTHTDLGGTAFLAAALNVPSVMGPVSVDVAGVTNASMQPIVIETTAAHNLTVQDRVLIQSVVGANNVNGAWWVSRIASPTTFQISNATLAFAFGTGDAYTGGGTVYDVTTSGGAISISAITNAPAGPVIVETASPHGFLVGDIVAMSSIGGVTALDGEWSVGEVLSPTSFEIAAVDAATQLGNGAGYSSGGTVTSGIFNAMVATGQIVGGGLASGNLYDDGQGTAIATQGIWGHFPDNARTLAPYSIALPVPNLGTAGDGRTTAAKALVVAPYVSVRIANNQEARIAGTLWDSYIQLSNAPYGTMASYDGVTFAAWADNTGPSNFFNATLFIRAQ
jgi:hypothetical protein